MSEEVSELESKLSAVKQDKDAVEEFIRRLIRQKLKNRLIKRLEEILAVCDLLGC